MGRNEKVAARPDENRPRSPMKKHWLATPKPFIAWGIFMGLMTGGAFAVAGLAAFQEGVVGAGAACILVAVLFPAAFITYSWWTSKD